MNPQVESAIVTLIQLIEKLKPLHLEEALDEIDLSDEGFKQELDIVKAAVNWIE